MKRFLVLVMILLLAVSLNHAQEKAEDSKLVSEQEVPEAPLLEWPIHGHTGYGNYAQELIFNRKKPIEFMIVAWAYYMAGYNGVKAYLGDDRFDSFRKVMGIKIYEDKPDIYDKYIRNPYQVEIFTMTSGSLLSDFIESEWYFTRALEILRDKVQWDPQVTNKEIYKDLVRNIYRSLTYCSLYIGNYRKALKYLMEYKKFGIDAMFVSEWESRIWGVLVAIAKKYDWVFVGKMSYDYMKKEHKKILLEAINMYYPGESVLKEELKKRIYPELHIDNYREYKPSTNQFIINE
ncbi:MAG: hypothetical protein KKH98_12215 [Spirochaetes bacterium]|nr:hypothetical protein [Spirochaetota bacterium]